MRVEIGMGRGIKNKKHDPKRAYLRRASTLATGTHTISGKKRERSVPKPITLPKLDFGASKD